MRGVELFKDLSPEALQSLVDRFESKIAITDNINECWVWLAQVDRDGYGRFRVGGRKYFCHRVSYTLYVSQIPNGLMVRHRCNNKSCVNPNHLIVGTAKQNSEDIRIPIDKDIVIISRDSYTAFQYEKTSKFDNRASVNKEKRTTSSLIQKNSIHLSDEDRFDSKIDKTSDCWLWTGQLNENGYGLFYAKGKKIRAHRYSYLMYLGKIPSGLFVCHSCDNPRCVNPLHLFVGTAKENTRDMMNKGRQGFGSGRSIQLSKKKTRISNLDIKRIVSLYEEGFDVDTIALILEMPSTAVLYIIEYHVYPQEQNPEKIIFPRLTTRRRLNNDFSID